MTTAFCSRHLSFHPIPGLDLSKCRHDEHHKRHRHDILQPNRYRLDMYPLPGDLVQGPQLAAADTSKGGSHARGTLYFRRGSELLCCGMDELTVGYGWHLWARLHLARGCINEYGIGILRRERAIAFGEQSLLRNSRGEATSHCIILLAIRHVFLGHLAQNLRCFPHLGGYISTPWICIGDLIAEGHPANTRRLLRLEYDRI